jgi:hypothetical protein
MAQRYDITTLQGLLPPCDSPIEQIKAFVDPLSLAREPGMRRVPCAALIATATNSSSECFRTMNMELVIGRISCCCEVQATAADGHAVAVAVAAHMLAAAATQNAEPMSAGKRSRSGRPKFNPKRTLAAFSRLWKLTSLSQHLDATSYDELLLLATQACTLTMQCFDDTSPTGCEQSDHVPLISECLAVVEGNSNRFDWLYPLSRKWLLSCPMFLDSSAAFKLLRSVEGDDFRLAAVCTALNAELTQWVRIDKATGSVNTTRKIAALLQAACDAGPVILLMIAPPHTLVECMAARAGGTRKAACSCFDVIVRNFIDGVSCHCWNSSADGHELDQTKCVCNVVSKKMVSWGLAILSTAATGDKDVNVRIHVCHRLTGLVMDKGSLASSANAVNKAVHVLAAVLKDDSKKVRTAAVKDLTAACIQLSTTAHDATEVCQLKLEKHPEWESGT